MKSEPAGAERRNARCIRGIAYAYASESRSRAMAFSAATDATGAALLLRIRRALDSARRGGLT